MTIPEYLGGVLVRDLRTLKREIEAYPDEPSLWLLPPGLGNSAGTLALHLAGNLRHFVGAVLAASDYVRDREAEFSRRNVPRPELLRGLDAAIAEVERTVPGLEASLLEREYPILLGKVRVTIGDFLIHLATHLAYHLGQVDSHRRVVTGQNTTVGAQAIPELRSAHAVV